MLYLVAPTHTWNSLKYGVPFGDYHNDVERWHLFDDYEQAENYARDSLMDKRGGESKLVLIPVNDSKRTDFELIRIISTNGNIE